MLFAQKPAMEMIYFGNDLKPHENHVFITTPNCFDHWITFFQRAILSNLMQNGTL